MPADTSVNPLAMSPEEAARVLSKAGGRPLTAQQIQADLAAGVPRNADGTLSLVTYCAWLLQQPSGPRPQASGDGPQ